MLSNRPDACMKKVIGPFVNQAVAAPQKYFELSYQGIIDVRTGKPRAFEALPRLRASDDSVVGPDVFIPLLETSGDIVPFGRWVLYEACKQTSLWREAFELQPWQFQIHVNVSPVEVASPDWQKSVLEILERTYLPYEFLQLEITETKYLRPRYHWKVWQLIKKGVTFAADDIDAGFGLKNVTNGGEIFSTWKVGVVDLEIEALQGFIVSAANAHKRLIVEQASQDILDQIDCRYVQSYLFCQPLGLADATELLSHHFPVQQVLRL
jgi:EAL domain-containing protein (putative c-di-GMP-specific phosphodiesterase class I)